MKKILIALDYGPTAQKIAESGYELAKAMNAQSILLHVTSDATYYSSRNYSPVMGFDSFNGLVETDDAENLKKAAQNYLDKSKQYLGNENIETIVKNGDFSELILSTAEEFKVDIIVMGTHSRSGFEKALMGSVAEKVLHHSMIPIFIIPGRSIENQ